MGLEKSHVADVLHRRNYIPDIKYKTCLSNLKIQNLKYDSCICRITKQGERSSPDNSFQRQKEQITREYLQKRLFPITGWARRKTFFLFSDSQYFYLTVKLKKYLALPEMSHSTKADCSNFILVSFSSLKNKKTKQKTITKQTIKLHSFVIMLF